MDQTTQFLKSQFNEATHLARAGQSLKALDICWWLRLQVELSIYLRASVNLLIAALLDDEKTSPKYAQEAIDLLDILRQQSEGLDLNKKELAQVEKIENTARSVLESFQAGRDGPTPRAHPKDIFTGLLSDPVQDEDQLISSPTKKVTTQLEHMDLTQSLSSSTVPVPKSDPSQPYIEIKDDVDVGDGSIIPTDDLRIEGFLRHPYYRPLQATMSPVSQASDGMDVDTGGQALQSPPPSSPPQRDANNSGQTQHSTNQPVPKSRQVFRFANGRPVTIHHDSC